MKKVVQITHYIEVEIDENKLTQEFNEQFNKTIGFIDTPEEHLVHIANYFAQFDEPYRNYFLEGYGPMNEMGIKVNWVDTQSELVEY